MKFKQSYSVAIPVYNEQQNILKTIKAINNSFLMNDDDCITIIFINDGSTDDTKKIIEANLFHSKIKLISHKTNLGYGSALKTAISLSKSTSKYIVFIDSDLTNPIKDIKKIKKFILKDIDFIQGDRISAGLELIPPKRRFFTKNGNIIANFFMQMKLNDYTGGFRCVKLELYKNVNLKQNDFSIIMEEKYKLKDKINNIAQFATKIYNRKTEIRETSFNYHPIILLKYLSYAVLAFFKRRRYR